MTEIYFHSQIMVIALGPFTHMDELNPGMKK